MKMVTIPFYGSTQPLIKREEWFPAEHRTSLFRTQVLMANLIRRLIE
ncbi:MAG: hypothetical protein Greene101449_1245, partial [Candidatus Peregrinibacteria bacterium Greene1014_49]